MNNLRSLAAAMLLGVSALTVTAAPVFAATAAPMNKAAPLSKPAVAKRVAAKSEMSPRSTVASKQVARPTPRIAATHSRGRMVTTKTSAGKTITYDCSLAGNKAKQACKT